MYLILKAFLLLTLTFTISCLQPKSLSSNSRKDETPYSPVENTTLDADLFFNQGFDVSYDSKSLLALGGDTYTYSVVNKPSWMNINAGTGIITGTPDENKVYVDVEFIATANSDFSQISSGVLDIGINGDPLRIHSWHLDNTGQDAFAMSSGSSGFDINVSEVFKLDLFGRGVKIAVSDSGVEINHDDLHKNMLSGSHKNFTINYPYIGKPTPSSAHGTAVSGIIGARGWNNIGGLGVAPLSQIAGFQFLESSQSEALLIGQASGDFDIYNYSYGDTIFHDTASNPDYLDHLRYQSKNGRSGKGAIFVKASGNDFLVKDSNSSPSICTSHNASLPYENESPFVLIVGAINADGQKASYSAIGSNLWVSAPGGEDGALEPAIFSTDLPTCFKGYSKATGIQYNDFEYGHALNQLCNYTSLMNGTSAAAPVVSGVIALMLEANPALSVRDVKHILVMTSTKIDPSSTTSPGSAHISTVTSGCLSLALTGYAHNKGWVTNTAVVPGGSITYNNFYGFGAVNAKAAVDMALDTASDPMGELPLSAQVELSPSFDTPAYENTSLALEIPDVDKDGVTNVISVTPNHFVETVQIKVGVTHAKSGQVGIELISPSGTVSQLLDVNNSLLISGDIDLSVVLTTNAFYGERSNGNWTIRAIDGKAGTSGTLDSWKINILGH